MLTLLNKTVRRDREGKSMSLYLCQCGARIVRRDRNVANGDTTSCGCHHKAIVTKHGMWKSREYSSWGNMKQRCNNSNHTSYLNYGGRGISICERWNDFENFHADMGDRPVATSLDRINNDGNYEPSNCKWSTRKEQRANMRPGKYR